MDVDFLNTVVTETRPRVLEHFSPDSCVATTRILIDVLEYFGVPGKPYAVEVAVFNQEARLILESDGLEAVAEAVHARSTEETGGPWTLGLGLNIDTEDGAGHVVVGVPGMGVLLDGSIDQVSRPRKNILLEPFAVHIPETGFFSHPDGQCGFTTTVNGHESTLVYTRSPVNRYAKSPNWRRQLDGKPSRVFHVIAADVIRAVRERD